MTMIAIIGAGKVGANAAMRMAEMNLDDLVLIDLLKDAGKGEALDISHSCCDVSVAGTDSFEDMQGAGLVINAAGAARKPGMSRSNLAKTNLQITQFVAGKIRQHAPDAVVMQVANPVDLMTLAMLRRTSFERSRVVGMGSLLDSMRFSYLISRELNVFSRHVHCMVIGEHGDSMVPLPSQATVSGTPLGQLMDAKRVEALSEKTRTAGADVIALKGSTYFAPSAAIAAMAEAIVKDSKKTFPVSAYLEGEYGVSGVCIGAPAVLGKQGIESIVELNIEEKALFVKSASVLKSMAAELGI